MTDLLRPARSTEVPALNVLIAASARGLSGGFYTPEETDLLIRHVFGVDTQLIADQTYFVIERDGTLAACGGWSGRRTLFGGDQAKETLDPLLDPATEAARIRAFFVRPEWARQGLGRRMLSHAESCAARAGFRRAELMATLPGEPFYRDAGYERLEPVAHRLPGGATVRLVRMGRALREGAVRALLLLALVCRPGATGLGAQATPAPAFPANELTVTAEPLAGGIQYVHGAGSFRLGIGLTAGPVYGVVLGGPEFGRLREWATAYPVLGLRVSPRFTVALSPIGAALLGGDDFGAVYPSAQAGAELALGAIRVGSWVRVVRIAGGDGTGSYRVVWSPVRLGYAMRW
ncbi:MAG TPA: GNAT family N-acetyltransferase [Gemmatimonadales bacterium]|jgi:GNAT superfamily N-acetyltransferase